MNSCLYEGWVRHRRFKPRAHHFRYRLFMLYVDLEELPTLFAKRWLWSVEGVAIARFRRRDHLGDPRQPLADSVRELVASETGSEPVGAIRLLTHFGYFGYRFNPVSFYYCFSADGSAIDFIVAEINNTPWRQQHCYVLDCRQQGGRRFSFDKTFHVSPFMPMQQRYQWRFNHPGKNLVVQMENYQQQPQRLFDATLVMEQKPITGRSLASVLVRFPLMTVQVVWGIYWQALRLWCKRVPFHPHPRTADKHKLSVEE